MKTNRAAYLTAIALHFSLCAIAQETAKDSTTIQLEEVTVNALGIQTPYETYGGSIAIVNREILNTTVPTNIVESLNQVSGVYMHSGALNTNRITIRGIGARSPFSTNKIRSYFGDIPLTNGSGETTIEDIDLSSIASYEVIKGPNSSIYGGGLGGVIVLNPLRGEYDQMQIANDLTVGSFGLVKEQISFSMQKKHTEVYASAGHLTSEGYRDNNEVDRTHFLLNLRTGTDRHVFQVLTYFVDQKAFIPSSLNESDFENEPTKAAFTWGAAQGFEDYITFLQGVSWSASISSNLTLKSSLFLSHNDNYEPRPFNILDESTTGWGTRTRLIGDLSDDRTTWMVGTEIFFDQHQFETYQNLYRDFPTGTGSVQGSLLSDFKENRSYINVFAQVEHQLSDQLLLSGGLNFNRTSYDLEDRFDDDLTDQSGDYAFEGVLSPRLSLNYALSPHVSFYSAISHGFSPPTLEETLLPDGTTNNDIQPETGLNFELGSRGAWRNVSFDAAIYQMQVHNLLVARRTADDQFIGINAGETAHFGLESSVNVAWIKLEDFELSTSGTYTYSNFKFDEFIDGESDFSGNQLTGVPRHIANSRLTAWFNSLNLYMHLDGQYVSQIPITDGNTVFSSEYFVFNGSLGHQLKVGKWSHDLSFNLRNLTDRKYPSMVLINATGFGGAAPRYFYPGLPLNWFLRLRVSLQI